MENIFEGAKFGDLFRTKDNRKAIFLGIVNEVIWGRNVNFYQCIIEGMNNTFCYYNADGVFFDKTISVEEDNSENLSDKDIVSRWFTNSDINEEYLNELATTFIAYRGKGAGETAVSLEKRAYKMGYCDAKSGK